MNASNAFRSNLMQQLASAALKSQRPPLALTGWIQSLDNNDHEASSGGGNHRLSSSSSHGNLLSSIGSSGNLIGFASPRQHVSPSASAGRTNHSHLPSSSASAALSSSTSNSPDEGDETDSHHTVDHLARDFQTLLQTRRTGTRLLPRESSPHHGDASFWNDALERAVRCAIQAPNHKRTEPVTFKRLVAPSERTRRLSEIAYETHLRKKLASLPYNASQQEKNAIRASVDKKRRKWDQIPAYLVTLVNSSHPVVDIGDDEVSETTAADPYQPLPFSPATTERELEDYATACTAVQNCLLSLHAEHIATKWVTGPVVRTPAFRELVQAKKHDRVVALVMVGEEDDSKQPHRRRMRRAFHGDLLVDL